MQIPKNQITITKQKAAISLITLCYYIVFCHWWK